MIANKPKKRNRRVYVCDSCRARKTRCDKNQPCTNCIRNGSECTYSTADIRKTQLKEAWKRVPTKDSRETEITNIIPALSSELDFVKSKIRFIESSIQNASEKPKLEGFTTSSQISPLIELDNLPLNFDINNEEINFNEDLAYCDGILQASPILFQRPLQFQGISKGDPGARLFWRYKSLPTWSNALQTNITIQTTLIDASKKKSVIEKAKSVYGEAYIPSTDVLNYKTHPMEIVKAISNYAQDFGISFCSSPDTKLLDRLIVVIPSREANLRWISVFFRKLYPVFPLIDEEDYRHDLDRILGLSELNGVVHQPPKMENKHDLAIIIIHLMILRLSYLSFLEIDSHTNRPDDEETTFLRSNPISLCAVEVAETCLKEFDLMRRQPMVVLQAALMLRLYRLYAPEEGDGAATSGAQIFNGTLIQLGISIGLNREPDLFVCSTVVTEKRKNLRRKIWYILMALDLQDSMVFGSIPTIDVNNHDVQMPQLKSDNANLGDLFLEKKVIASLNEPYLVFRLTKALVKCSSNIQESSKVSRVLGLLSELEYSLAQQYGTFTDYLTPKSDRGDIFKILRFGIYLRTRLYTLYVLYCMFLYFERKNIPKLKFHYFKKSLRIIFHELGQLTEEFLLSASNHFDSGFTLLTVPAIELYCHTVVLICQAIRIRFNCTLRDLKKRADFKFKFDNDTSFQEFYCSLGEARDLLRSFSLGKIGVLGLLCRRYQHSWKARKSHLFGMKLVESNFIYESDPTAATEAIISFTNEEMNEIIDLMKSSHQCDSTFDCYESEDCLVREVQTDNMWLQLNTFREDEEKLPEALAGAGCLEAAGFGTVKNCSNTFSTFNRNDFDLFTPMDLPEELWFQSYSIL
ncbi:fungal-specific transcription factor [Scheffersomyces xylosifermentans]|uniref:fungal-specific transcription factor n=1 Tax=Scheffersomyces xylosifermentans TaxID=1304137 RepID=UPI00315D7F29